MYIKETSTKCKLNSFLLVPYDDRSGRNISSSEQKMFWIQFEDWEALSNQ